MATLLITQTKFDELLEEASINWSESGASLELDADYAEHEYSFICNKLQTYNWDVVPNRYIEQCYLVVPFMKEAKGRPKTCNKEAAAEWYNSWNTGSLGHPDMSIHIWFNGHNMSTEEMHQYFGGM